jgi:hypothetical protein
MEENEPKTVAGAAGLSVSANTEGGDQTDRPLSNGKKEHKDVAPGAMEPEMEHDNEARLGSRAATKEYVPVTPSLNKVGPDVEKLVVNVKE